MIINFNVQLGIPESYSDISTNSRIRLEIKSSEVPCSPELCAVTAEEGITSVVTVISDFITITVTSDSTAIIYDSGEKMQNYEPQPPRQTTTS
jgi:hypothetical protein